MRERRPRRLDHEAASPHLRGMQRSASNTKAGDTRLLARLSPNALVHWPSVARQLADAGLLDSVDGELLLCYCEAYARWCAAGDQLATMLIAIGLSAGHRSGERADHAQNVSHPAAATEPRPEPVRRVPNAILRRAEVEGETGLSRSTIYQRIKAGTFPLPVRLGVRSVGWRVADIETFLASPADYKPPRASG